MNCRAAANWPFLSASHIKRFMRPLFMAASFLIPFLIMLLIYWRMDMAPFGDNSVLIYDMSLQYVGFFGELRNIVEGHSNIFFSWSKAYGSSLIGVFAYYLSSPFSLFTLLFRPENLPIALMFLTAIKIGLAGFSVYIYFKLAFRKWGIPALMFSACYALMSYSTIYSMNIMWLDGLIWLPVILLGIEKLLSGKFPWLLAVSLVCMFISNFYISYMVGIFSAFYFLIRVFSENRQQTGQLFLRFFLSAVIAAGLSSWLLIPAGLDLFSGKLAQGGVSMNGGMYFLPWEFLHKFLPFQYDNIIDVDSFPSIFCGTVPLFFSILYFCLPIIRLREKILSLILLILIGAGFCSRSLDFIWHGFQYPNCYPYRYAFLFSFMIIFLAFRSFYQIPFGQIAKKLIRNQTLHTWIPVMSILLLSVLFLWQAIELTRNGKYMLASVDKDFRFQSLSSYQSFYMETSPLIELANHTDGFYRIEKNYEWGKNDAMLFGYKGITHYSSLFNENLNQFTKQIGLGQGWYWNTNYGNTLLTNTFFNVRYLLSRTPLPDFYRPVHKNGSVTLYENPYALPVGFMAEDLSGIDSIAFKAQNEMLNKASGLNYSYFTSCELQKHDENEFDFTAAKDAAYYLYIPVDENTPRQVYIQNEYKGEYSDADTRCIMPIGNFQSGEIVDIMIVSSETLPEPVVCFLNIDQFEEAYRELSTEGLSVTEYGADYIHGIVNASEAGSMMTSIPYDDGFQIMVNRQKVPGQKAFNTFLSFPVPEGESIIDIQYTARGSRTGMIISILSAAGGLAWGFVSHSRRKISKSKNA